MSIIENEHGVFVKYKIPQGIKEKIPEHFYLAFARELFSVFGLGILEKDEDGFPRIEHSGGTTGWAAALKQTCKKVEMIWLWDYWNSLEWYDSDLFDGEIEEEIANRLEQDSSGANLYYAYLTKL